jgi:hypothetical protein
MNHLDRPSARSSQTSAFELRMLSPSERDRILADQVRLAEAFYRGDPELTAFETFGEGDIHDHGPTSEAG